MENADQTLLNNSELNHTPPVSSAPQTPPSDLKPKQKLPLAIIIGIVLFLLVAGSVAGFYVFKQQSLKSIKPTPSPVVQKQIPTPTSDPTASWKTYTSNDGKFSFKYPQNLFLKENVKDYLVLTKTADAPGNLSEISIDARLTGIYSEYNSAIESVKKSLTDISTKDFSNGIVIKGKMGPGMGEGTPTITGLIRYKTGVIAIQNSTNPLQEETLNQILSTFTFAPLSASKSPDQNATPTPTCMPRPACLDATPRCMIAEPANGWCP